MSENQTQTQTVTGAGSLQRAESRAKEIEELRSVIKTCEQEEATLFAYRGYGGYIESEAIGLIRKTRDQARAELQALQSGGS